MAALTADGALYISWTPVGATMFKISRNKLYEVRLFQYLAQFSQQAFKKLPFKQGGNCQEALATSLTNEVKEMAKAVPMVAAVSAQPAAFIVEAPKSEAPAVIYEAGSLLKGAADVVYYITEVGQRRPILDPKTFAEFGFSAKDVVAVEDEVLASLPSANPLSRLVLDKQNNLYWVLDGQRWQVNEWKSVVLGDHFTAVPVTRADNTLLNSLATQKALPHGSFLRQNDKVFYYLYNAIIPLAQGDYNNDLIIDVPFGVLDVYPQQDSIKPMWSTLKAEVQAANLRSGPGLEFEIVELIEQTEHFLIRGRAENSNWLQVSYEGHLAWLAGDLVEHDFLLKHFSIVGPQDVEAQGLEAQNIEAQNIEAQNIEQNSAPSQEPTNSSIYIGIGVAVADKGNLPLVSKVRENQPAHQAGIQPSDMIVAIDGVSMDNIGSNEVVSYLRGDKGEEVVLTIARSGLNRHLDITVARAEINMANSAWLCDDEPIRGFGNAWREQPETHIWLGCPFINFRRDEHATPSAVQTFEGGWMLWLETDTVANIDPIYVFFEDDHSYIRYGDRELVDAHSYTTEPSGFYKVGDRFAKVYWEEIGPSGRTRLGHATNEARDSKGAFQEFENGRMFWSGEADTIYVIYQGSFDFDNDGQAAWIQGWMAYEDTFEAP